MINNWDYQSLRMDFSSMYEGNHHPSDIDMLYLGKGDVLVLGEIKNERGELKKGQRHLLETLAEGWKTDAVILYIVHKDYYQKGARKVDVSKCIVKEIYYKKIHQWRFPKQPVTVGEIIEYYGRKK